MKCLTCPDSTLAITERSGVEIDYCPTCRGVWLDRGELDKIIDRVVGPGGAAPAAEPRRYEEPRREAPRSERYDDRRDDRPDDRYGRPRKRRSFLEDIFDFD